MAVAKSLEKQKQTPELFCKKRCSFFFDKVTDLRAAQVFSSEFCEISKNSFFYRTTREDYFWRSFFVSFCSVKGFLILVLTS